MCLLFEGLRPLPLPGWERVGVRVERKLAPLRGATPHPNPLPQGERELRVRPTYILRY
jgi:hypothetical protein